MTEEDTGNAFRSARSMWQQRAASSEGSGKKSPRFRTRDGSKSNNQPPLSPSSRKEGIDPFHAYGIVFNAEHEGLSANGTLTIKRLIPGGSADLAGVIFPGDTLNEVEGSNVLGSAAMFSDILICLHVTHYFETDGR
jgi:hypothetical protein